MRQSQLREINKSIAYLIASAILECSLELSIKLLIMTYIPIIIGVAIINQYFKINYRTHIGQFAELDIGILIIGHDLTNNETSNIESTKVGQYDPILGVPILEKYILLQCWPIWLYLGQFIQHSAHWANKVPIFPCYTGHNSDSVSGCKSPYRIFRNIFSTNNVRKTCLNVFSSVSKTTCHSIDGA